MSRYFLPLRQLIPDGLVPDELLAFEEPGVLDVVGITSYRVESLPDGVYVAADLGIDPDHDGDPGVVLAFPPFPELALECAALGRLELWIREEFQLRVSMGALAIRLPRALLHAVDPAPDGGFVPRPAPDDLVRVTLAAGSAAGVASEHPFALTIDRRGRIDLEYPDPAHAYIEGSLSGPAMVGDTGVVLEVDRLGVSLDPADPAILLHRARVTLPPDIQGAPAVELTDARLGRDGVSGTVAATWPLEFDEGTRRFVYRAGGPPADASLFGLNGGLRQIALTLEDNRLTGADLGGGLLVPYFDEPVDIRLDIEPDGDFRVTLTGADADGLSLSREEVLALHLKALSLAKRTEGSQVIGEVVVSGGLEPLILARDGLQWPRLDVVGLSIDTAGRFRIAEAWLDLEKLKPLDLWGFVLELKRVGLGYEESRDRLWLDLSGGLRLLPQLPLGFDVEGFRLSWPREFATVEELAGQVEVQFAGIHLFYGIPDAVEFEGQIRFFRDAQVVGFAGDVALRVPATGLAIEAGLMIGMVLAPPPPFPFLYVYLGVELPAGIPLGQSGLALKGALGLFGLNVAPARAPDENWYYDWYKRPPIVGAHPTNKWEPARDAIALGVGVTITTVDGYVKGVRALLVLAIPGPILIIEGRGLVFDGLGPGEPPLRALAVFDGAARTVQFNLEARAEVVEDVLEAWGGLEAFFDFADLTNWHLYLGQDTPAERRIQANILKLATGHYLFNANAYLMLDMVDAGTLRSRMGFVVGLTQTFDDYDPLKVELRASVGGDGVATIGPEELSGRVGMEAAVRLSAFGVGLQLSARADVLAEAPNPFSVDATLEVAADIPAPLEDFEAEFHFAWEGPAAVTVETPLVAVSATSDLVAGGGVLALHSQGPVAYSEAGGSSVAADARLPESVARDAAEAAPVVPMDARPTLAFAHDMNDGSGGLFARDSRGDGFSHDIGRIRLRPGLRRVELYRHRAEEPWGDDFATNWRLVASTDAAPGADRLWGAWLADAAPDAPTKPGTRRLRFWTANPFVAARASLGPAHQVVLGLAPPGDGPRLAYADAFLEDYPDYFRCRDTAAETCVDFADAPDPTGGRDEGDGKTPLRWTYAGLAFEATGGVRLRPGGRPPIATGRLDASALAALRAALADVERGFAALRQPLPASVLAEFASRLPPDLRDRLRGERPDLRWPVLGGPACLEVEGELHVRFPEPVRRVRLRFCGDPGLGAAQAQSRVTLERPPRTPAEIAEEEARARQKGEEPDLVRCRIPVPFTLTVTGPVWTVEAAEGFDCLAIRKGVRLEEICSVTAAEAERAARARAECDVNDEALDHAADDPPPLLDPGAYYRLLVYTAVDVDRLSAASDASFAEPVRALLDILYKAAMSALAGNENEGRFEFLQESFFRVEGPPTPLDPYVGWTHPAPEAVRVFGEDDVRIRFRRAGVGRMFERPPYRLELLVRHADGTVTPCAPLWGKAGGATRFPDEETWLDHLGADAPALPADDVLTGDRNGAALAPGARYELLVTGGAGGALLLEDRFLVPDPAEAWAQPAPAGWTIVPPVAPGVSPDGELRRGAGAPDVRVGGDPTWTDVDVTVEARGPSSGALGLVFRYSEDPATGAATYLRFVLDRSARAARIEHVGPAGVSASNPVPFATADQVFRPGEWVRLRVVAAGSRIRAWRFDTRLFDLATFAPAPPGRRPPRGGAVRWFDTARLPEAPIRGAIEAGGLAPAGPPAGRAGVYAAQEGSAFRRFAVRDAVLLRVPFTTSRFGRFRDLVRSFDGSVSRADITPWTDPGVGPAITAARAASLAYATAARGWERGVVRMRYQERRDREDPGLDEDPELGGREALEAHRLAVREAAAVLDDAMLALADLVGISLLDAMPAGLTVTALRSPGDGALRGFWLRSPESLDLLRPAGLDASVGRTTLGLQRRAASGAWQSVDIDRLADAASTHVLLLPGTAGLAATYPAGEYRLTFQYLRNHGDETRPGHHRYDRPVEPRDGGDAPEVVPIDWTI
jgi:hypothetical protein